MGKKIDRLRRVVKKLGERYGAQDEDVLRLQRELDALEAVAEAPREERRRVQLCRYTFGSRARQHYEASKQQGPGLQ
jgi:hypothetical protein